MKTNLRENQIVSIFANAVTGKGFLGFACLTKHMVTHDNGLERWLVRLVDDDQNELTTNINADNAQVLPESLESSESLTRYYSLKYGQYWPYRSGDDVYSVVIDARTREILYCEYVEGDEADAWQRARDAARRIARKRLGIDEGDVVDVV